MTVRVQQVMLLGAVGMNTCRAFSFSASIPRSVNGPSSSSSSLDDSEERPSLTSKLGFSFTPGGLLFPFHLGVAKRLEAEGYMASDSPVAGSSAGAIAATIVGCGMDIENASVLTATVFEECRTKGTVFRLKDVVHKALDKSLPDDAHEVINARKGQVTIGITNIFPVPKGVFVSEFQSRSDLIEVVLGSCHVPFWFSSWPYMQVRGKATIDGLFSMPRSYLGSPPTPAADQVVRVTVFPTSSVEVHSDRPGDIISPDMLDRYQSGRFLELLNYAMSPAEDKVMEELFVAGFECGGVWCDRYGEEFRTRHNEIQSRNMLEMPPGLA